MCGIAGIVDLQALDPSVLDCMRDRMAHRGPDDAGSDVVGSAGLASRRLAIIDITPDGHQPMTFGPFTIAYNGEIYNYVELRDELRDRGHHFVTQSDTEVLLHAYAEWGEACLNRLNGMFAFAIWNQPRGELLAARDRFGEKPFFYAQVGSSFIFASELKALTVFPGFIPQPNPAAIFRFLAYGQLTLPDETFFANAKRLPAAHSLRWTPQGVTTKRYFAIEGDELTLPFDEAVQQLSELLRDSIRLRLRSDVPVGSSLSGGVDSSTIVALVAELSHQRRTSFSATFPGFALDESTQIAHVVEKTHVENFDVAPTATDLAEDLDRLVYYQDEPFASSSMYAQWRVMELAKSHGITVLLDGQGADELLGGYPAYATSYLLTVAHQSPGSLAKEINGLRSTHGLGPARLLGGLWMSGYPDLVAPVAERVGARLFRDGLTVVNRDFAQDHANMWHVPRHRELDLFRSALLTTQELTVLPGLLRYADRNSMAHSVEVRLPYLDHRLAEFMFRLPARYKVTNGVMKHILRAAGRDLVPPSVRERWQKVGFVTPQAAWMREGLRARLEDILFSQPFRDRGVFAGDAVARQWRAHQAGTADHSNSLWRAAVLELWFETFIDRQSSGAVGTAVNLEQPIRVL